MTTNKPTEETTNANRRLAKWRVSVLRLNFRVKLNISPSISANSPRAKTSASRKTGQVVQKLKANKIGKREKI